MDCDIYENHGGAGNQKLWKGVREKHGSERNRELRKKLHTLTLRVGSTMEEKVFFLSD